MVWVTTRRPPHVSKGGGEGARDRSLRWGGSARTSLGLTGEEFIDIGGIDVGLAPGAELACRITRADGKVSETSLLCRIDTADELAYFNNGGILHYVLREILKAA